jgi:hypothetical protein
MARISELEDKTIETPKIKGKKKKVIFKAEGI